MLNLSEKQKKTKTDIEAIASLLGVDPIWASAVAMVESSLGAHQISPTGCKGVFQMSSIAMKDLLQAMVGNDDLIDIACGVAFLKLLYTRWGDIETATNHYCDPADRSFYMSRVRKYMREFEKEAQ